MKKTIQTKRNRKPGPSYRVLYAKTGRKRRLNAATATADAQIDLESDVAANVGIGKALLVILVLHVLAIGAIYTHSKFFSDESSASKDVKTSAAAVAPAPEPKAPAPKPLVAPAATPAVAPAPQPAIDDSNSRYIVVTGDTYHRIASVRNVDEGALRALNGERPLRAGVVLDLPNELSSRPVPAVISQAPERAEQATPERVEQAPERQWARAIEVVEDAPKAVVIKPKTDLPVETAGLRDSGQRYTVQSGDTVWRIANRYKVSRDDLLKLNGMDDPRKLGVGRELKIPAK